MKNLDFPIITITSKWYSEYTLNMLASIKKVGLADNVTTFCLDQDSFKEISSNGFLAKSIDTSYEITKKPTHYGTKELNRFMFYKMQIIRNELIKNKFILYTDGDVVFKKNIIDLIDRKRNFEILAIKDFDVSNPNKVSICAGFMMVKSNLKTRRLFNPNTIAKNNFNIQDQEIINSKKRWINYEFLDEKLYSNGSYFTNNSKKIDPVVVHFNYIVGEDKKDVMNSYGYWYL